MILITGAGGLVGREVAKALQGHPVRLGVHGAREAGIRFDFLDPSTFGPALDGVDRVFLLRPPQLARAEAHFGPFVETMKAAGVRQVVFLSVRAAERSRLLPHHHIERLIESSGLGWTHLRPSDFMQNFITVNRGDIARRGEIVAPAGRGKTGFVDVRDVGAAAAVVLTEEGHLGEAYTLTGPAALGLDEVAAILSEVLERRIVYRPIGALRYTLRTWRGGTALPVAVVSTVVHTIARLGFAAEVTPDLELLLGRPATAFRDFARDHADAWRA